MVDNLASAVATLNNGWKKDPADQQKKEDLIESLIREQNKFLERRPRAKTHGSTHKRPLSMDNPLSQIRSTYSEAQNPLAGDGTARAQGTEGLKVVDRQQHDDPDDASYELQQLVAKLRNILVEQQTE